MLTEPPKHTMYSKEILKGVGICGLGFSVLGSTWFINIVSPAVWLNANLKTEHWVHSKDYSPHAWYCSIPLWPVYMQPIRACFGLSRSIVSHKLYLFLVRWFAAATTSRRHLFSRGIYRSYVWTTWETREDVNFVPWPIWIRFGLGDLTVSRLMTTM